MAQHALRRYDVTPLVVADSGHWLMEEQPEKTVAAISGFLRQPG